MSKEVRYTYPFPRPMVTVDAVVFRRTRERLEVLVVERGHPPFAGQAALPGGFVEMEEDLLDAAKRELLEETGFGNVKLVQLAAFGQPGRDPRGRNVTVVYVGMARGDTSRIRGGDDAARAFWIPARRPGKLAFDHNDILKSALKWLRSRATAGKRRS
jgi:8-oxo-dGTP diphosphatase